MQFLGYAVLRNYNRNLLVDRLYEVPILLTNGSCCPVFSHLFYLSTRMRSVGIQFFPSLYLFQSSTHFFFQFCFYCIHQMRLVCERIFSHYSIFYYHYRWGYWFPVYPSVYLSDYWSLLLVTSHIVERRPWTPVLYDWFSPRTVRTGNSASCEHWNFVLLIYGYVY